MFRTEKRRARNTLITLSVVLAMILTSFGYSFAGTIKAEPDQVKVASGETQATFYIDVTSDVDFAGVQVGLKSSSDGVKVSSVTKGDDFGSAQSVETEKNGVYYYGVFTGSNAYSAGTYRLATVTAEYSGDEAATVTLDSSKIVSIENGKTNAVTDSEGFTVTITRAESSDGEVGGENSITQVEQTITQLSGSKDVTGSKYSPLKAKSTKTYTNKVNVTWSKVSGAKKYIIYGNKVTSKSKYKKLATVTGTSKSLTTIAGAKVKKGTYYKLIVVAVDSNDNVIAKSKTVYTATKGGKVGNYSSISTKAKKNKVSIKKGKTFSLGAKAAKAKKTTVKSLRGLRYESSNTKVAKVSSKGKITGVKKGTATIYVYAQNGLAKTIKVTVK